MMTIGKQYFILGIDEDGIEHPINISMKDESYFRVWVKAMTYRFRSSVRRRYRKIKICDVNKFYYNL